MPVSNMYTHTNSSDRVSATCTCMARGHLRIPTSGSCLAVTHCQSQPPAQKRELQLRSLLIIMAAKRKLVQFTILGMSHKKVTSAWIGIQILKVVRIYIVYRSTVTSRCVHDTGLTP